MKRVCAFALEGVVSFDLACVVQSFARGPGTAGEPDGFALTVCGTRAGAIGTPDGFGLRIKNGLGALDGADIVIVPGRFPYNTPPPREVITALRAAHARGAVVASICVGAFILAHAGLLDGRRATTHWAYCDELAQTFPAIDVEPEPLYIDEGQILTSAGLAAGLDLCLHLVRRERGAAAAARLARWNVLAPHREGGQAQFIPAPAPPASVGALGPTLEWAGRHLHESLPVARLAAHACVSERTLIRRFRSELGTTPKRWLLEQRIARARELLETTTLDIETIARASGLPSAPSLREHLRSRTSLTPTAYRRTYGPPSTPSHPAAVA